MLEKLTEMFIGIFFSLVEYYFHFCKIFEYSILIFFEKRMHYFVIYEHPLLCHVHVLMQFSFKKLFEKGYCTNNFINVKITCKFWIPWKNQSRIFNKKKKVTWYVEKISNIDFLFWYDFGVLHWNVRVFHCFVEFGALFSIRIHKTVF